MGFRAAGLFPLLLPCCKSCCVRGPKVRSPKARDGRIVDHGDILLTLAEVSVAFAGFSGVVAVFGRRDPNLWSFADRFRFFSLVHTSLSSLLLCIVPFGLFALNVPEASVWRSVSALFLLYMIVVVFLSTRRLLAASSSERAGFTGIGFYVSFATSAPMLILNFYNVAVGAAFGPFLVCLIFLLAVSSFLFARMLVSAFGAGRAAQQAVEPDVE